MGSVLCLLVWIPCFIMLRLGKVSVQSLQHWCSLDVVLQIIKSLIKLMGLIAVVYILLPSTRAVLTGARFPLAVLLGPLTRAVNSGSGNRALVFPLSFLVWCVYKAKLTILTILTGWLIDRYRTVKDVAFEAGGRLGEWRICADCERPTWTQWCRWGRWRRDSRPWCSSRSTSTCVGRIQTRQHTPGYRHDSHQNVLVGRRKIYSRNCYITDLYERS